MKKQLKEEIENYNNSIENIHNMIKNNSQSWLKKIQCQLENQTKWFQSLNIFLIFKSFMKITVTDGNSFINLEVDVNEEVENVKALLEAEVNVKLC